ncbi:BspA family leucine-rich repeat surface protein [Reichenbachiella carrageenanivorans]|uniref:BspA family leucine-rich repeat surface protein n=1 Tax=Reichenbachiella carrageenanivorans TaxID=2979869 RepID=A0ABY6D1C6_9BACT|nr:BspA family leucine-rich repeat surface protein [Reichenbachiella carrageenanivorans]UXX79961.1 BspA family leucine-rich repeat surface protein [Reichenbachiella carrageenanivorans]
MGSSAAIPTRLEISGDFPRIHFDNATGSDEILTVQQWGDIAWTSFSHAFYGCSELTVPATDAPDLTGVTSLYRMFYNASKLDNPMNHWVVNTIENFGGMFSGATLFDQPLDNWVVTAAEDMSYMFYNADAFDQNLNTWTPSNVTDMSYMFYSANDFNGSVDSWAVTKVEDMSRMFSLATSFNQSLAGWGSSTGAVTNMSGMFGSAFAFNQDLGDWDVSQVTNMSNMFDAATSFNNDGQPLDWDTQTGNLQNMNLMFRGAAIFNQDLSAWDVSKVLYMGNTFQNATAFNQSLANWDIRLVTSMNDMFRLSGLSQANYDATLIGWLDDNGGLETIPSDVSLGAIGLTYCEAAAAHAELQNASTHNWSITDSGQDCPFVTTWKPTDTSITIPTTGSGYNYDVYWENTANTTENGTQTARTTNTTISGLTAGQTYRVKINGTFPQIYFNNQTGSDELLTIEQWGDISWASMHNAFNGCTNLSGTTSDSPDLSSVTSLLAMFRGASLFNQDISGWDVSQVEAMNSMFYEATTFNNGGQPLDWANTDNLKSIGYMFYGATAFDQDISSWDVSNVTSMGGMFQNASNYNNGGQPLDWDAQTAAIIGTGYVNMFNGASKFNQDVSGWNVSGATNLSTMFYNATAFNNGGQPLDWDTQTASITNMSWTFSGASSFNQDISGWDVSAVTTMNQMFTAATAFDQNLGNWNIELVSNMNHMLSNSGLSTANYDATLIGWLDDNGGTETIPTFITLGATGLTYCEAATTKTILQNTPYNWTINDGGPNCAEPSTQASSLSLSNITLNTMTLNWINGDGTLRLVVVKEGSLPTSPSDGTAYTANTTFGSGDDINSESYVVYNGTGNSVTVTGLTPGSTYYYQVFEYNGSGNASIYNANTDTENPISHSTNINNGNAPGTAGIHFDGVDDYINVGNVPQLKFAGTNNYTISTWVKIEAHTDPLIIGSSFQSGSNSSWELIINASNKLIAYRHHTPYSMISNASINVGEWTHVAMTYDGTNLSIFINGVLDKSAVFANSQVTGPDVLFGARYDNTGQPELFFKGQMDEMQIWNVARSAAEIQADRYTTFPKHPNLIGYWNFDDDRTASNPTVATDLSNGYDGTLINSPKWTQRVINTNDDGTGSLREAITLANADTDQDFIDFSIPGTAPHTIQPVTDLPTITNPIVLDASTQPGSDNFNIILDGQGTLTNGFRINGNTSEVYGFYISDFTTGIFMGNPGGSFIIGAPAKGNTIVNNSDKGIFGLAAATCTIQSNYIGTDESGSVGIGNGVGLDFSTGANGQTIGGDNPSERNIISGNNTAIATNASSNYQIKGNYIGTNPAGSTAIPNVTGIALGLGSGHLIQNNVISGNSGTAISLNQTSSNTIQGNYIGVAADGTTALGNQTGIGSVTTGNVDNNIIGGTDSGEPNIIAYNTNMAAFFHGANMQGNQLIGNSTYCNGSGLSLIGIGNNNILPPTISTVTSSLVTGTGRDGDEIHLYRDNDCTPAQGKEYLGTTTVAAGTWSLVPASTLDPTTDKITATATTAADGTSEFATYLIDQYTVSNTLDAGAGSLRWAINNANASTNETITFNLAGSGPWVISLATELPTLSTTTIIDASTQPGWSSSNLVQIDGASIKDETGMNINANDCEIYGFEITGFSESGGEAIATTNIVVGGQIGDGTRGNVIGDNHTGIDLRGSNVMVQGNKIGTNNDGNTANPNQIGILMSDGGSGNTIGGSNTGEGNLISANTSSGITLRNTTNHEIKGNRIGVGLDDGPLSNLVGISLSTFGGVTEDVIIGGVAPGEANIIAHNQRVNSIAVAGGIYIESPTIASGQPIVTGTTIRGNVMYCNAPDGIVFTNDANNGIEAPILTGFTTTEITGTCSTCSTGDLIDIYRDNSTCEPAQGSEYLGTVVYASDPWTFATSGLSLSDKITATATDAAGNTSRFFEGEPALEVYEGIDNTGTLLAAPYTIALDPTPVGTAQTVSLTIYNNSQFNVLHISSVNLSSSLHFSLIDVIPGQIERLSQATFKVQFEGTAGEHTGLLTIVTDDPVNNSILVTIEAEGEEEEIEEEEEEETPVNPPPAAVTELVIINGEDNNGTTLQIDDIINLGQTVQNEDLEKVFVIDNIGSTDLVINTITVDNAIFEVLDFTKTVPVGSYITFTVRLLAQTVGNHSTQVDISTEQNNFTFTLTGEVTARNQDIHVYNVVTPNGDGIHDFLKIDRITEYPDNQVSIVDRWGRTVFSENHYDNDKVVFDGHRNGNGNGELLPAGTYYYVILTGSDKKTGFIQLSTDN